MRVRFAAPAQQEVAEARSFYSRVAPRQRAGFNTALRRSVALLTRYPQAGGLAGAQVRRQVLDGYPYTLLYIHGKDEVHIHALMHHRRDPARWADLLWEHT